MYEREHDGERVLVVANLGDERLVVPLGDGPEWSVALSTSDRAELKNRLVLLPRHSAVILRAG